MDHGVKLEKFSDKVYDGFAGAANEVFEETRASSGLAERVHSSFLKARKDIGSWTNLSDSPYISQRNRALGM
jgi:TRAP-type mannitol/chloroaromatic compound transport system, periplasmic component